MQISHNCRIEFSINLKSFRHKFPQRCFLQFVMEDCLQNGRFCSAWGSKKSILFATRSERQTFFIYFGHPLDPFQLHSGSLWLACGYLWLPFDSFLALFDSLLLPLGLRFLTFSVSWRHYWYLNKKQQNFNETKLLVNQIALSRRVPNATQQEVTTYFLMRPYCNVTPTIRFLRLGG